MSPEDTTAAKAEMTLNQGLLENLKNMREQYEGRISIRITDSIDQWAGSADDLLLKDGDSIAIPQTPQEVLVMGEVHSPSAQVFLPGQKVKDVINLTGGYTKFAEKDQVYVLQANGSAISGDSLSIGNIGDKELKAGDTIFVPQKTERNAGMRFFKDVIDILFKTAVVIATITISCSSKKTPTPQGQGVTGHRAESVLPYALCAMHSALHCPKEFTCPKRCTEKRLIFWTMLRYSGAGRSCLLACVRCPSSVITLVVSLLLPKYYRSEA